jgi:predicted phosphatase
MSELHEQHFESLYESQMKSINNSTIRDAKRVILDLMNVVVDNAPTKEKDGAVEHALGWLKNNVS